MSFRHVEALSVIRDEFDAVRGSVAYVRGNWNDAAATLDPIKLHELLRATERLEATYIVRLTAGYEAIVDDVLKKSTPRKVRAKASGVELTNELAGWLQGRVKTMAPRLQTSDRAKIANIKARAAEVLKLLRYRNQIAHREPPRDQEFSFRSARAALNYLLDLIP